MIAIFYPSPLNPIPISETPHFVRITVAYDARSNEELSVANGDIVELISQRWDAGDGWWTGVSCEMREGKWSGI